jgi:hypothetical protein
MVDFPSMSLTDFTTRLDQIGSHPILRPTQEVQAILLDLMTILVFNPPALHIVPSSSDFETRKNAYRMPEYVSPFQSTASGKSASVKSQTSGKFHLLIYPNPRPKARRCE